MTLEKLTPEERQVVHECLIAASGGPLHGPDAPLAHAILETWPSFDETEERVREVKTLLRRLVSEPAAAWSRWISASPAQVEAIIRKWDGPLIRRLFARFRFGGERGNTSSTFRTMEDLPLPSGARLLDQAKRYLDMATHPHLAEPILELAAQDPGVRSECLVRLAEIDVGMTRFEEARARCDEVLPALRSGSDKPLFGLALMVRGWAAEENERPWFEEALPLFLDSDLPFEAAQCLEAMGADAELERAAELYGKTDSRLGRPRVLRRRAVLAIGRGDTTAAIEFCREALAGLEGVLLVQARADECFCIEVIGDAHRDARNKDEAATAYRTAHERLMRLEHGHHRDVRAKLDELRDGTPSHEPPIEATQGPREEPVRGLAAVVAAAGSGDMEVIRATIDAGEDLDVAGADGMTALMKAAGGGHVEAVDLLVAKGARVNTSNKRGETAITFAAGGGSAGVIERLLAAGAEVDARTEDGQTPLMFAAGAGHLAAVKVLLAGGAGQDVTGYALKTALDYARRGAHSEIVDLLKPPARDVPIVQIPRVSDEEVTVALKRLNEAIWSDDLAAAVQALSAGAKVDGDDDTRPICNAAHAGHFDLVRLLAENGADVNAEGVAGFSALAKACGGTHEEMAQYLLNKGAKVTSAVIMAASVHRHPGIMRMLETASTISPR